MKKRIALGVVLALAMAGIAGCSSDGSDMGGMGHGSDSSQSPAASAEFNDADVTFVQGMIPHHQQAVEMATLAETRADSAEVKGLAAKIKGAQDPEIKQMQGYLKDWGQNEPSGMGGDSMSMDHGMMSDADMTKLEDASGAEFDQMFLTMMIEHHKGAIEQAETELADGKSAGAKKLAKAIVTAQKAEITTMEDLIGKAG
ncbi:DUF305 domain-containing protein [Aquihabitans sp. G128]|uniref:DUF305 domain-containing protein n=1 Tax=Aquihabitans sp. G128 TaxID=2849779 RepID=UPI001C24D06B|nr:DUF305 domain-containing protein [Aquihabitans sp. G128]QXC60586.1 DUF305 domain-containing protein [Aquihabitans sp. G128]